MTTKAQKLSKNLRLLCEADDETIENMDSDDILQNSACLLLKLEKQCDELRNQLIKYGDHHRQCGIGGSHTEGDCECGFTKVIAVTKAQMRQQ